MGEGELQGSGSPQEEEREAGIAVRVRESSACGVITAKEDRVGILCVSVGIKSHRVTKLEYGVLV